eukprot:scaffold27794_cov106-Isochrysis_galbana.AAC.3
MSRRRPRAARLSASQIGLIEPLRSVIGARGEGGHRGQLTEGNLPSKLPRSSYLLYVRNMPRNLPRSVAVHATRSI